MHLGRRYAAIGDQHFFEHGLLRLHLSTFRLERFRVLTMNPHICPRIKAIKVVGDNSSLQDIISFWQAARNGLPRQKPRPTFRKCIRKLANLESIEFSVNTNERPGTIQWGCQTRLLIDILNLLYDTQVCTLPNLKSLKSDNLHWHIFQLAIPHVLASRERAQINASRLVNLDITLRRSDAYSTALQMVHLYKFLYTTINLESLTLNFGSLENYKVNPVFNFGKICTLEFSQLRSLGFSFGNVHGGALYTFLVAHHTTLKEVQLGSLALNSMRWDYLLKQLAMWLRGLQKIKLSGWLTDPWHQSYNMSVCGEHNTHLVMEHYVRPSIPGSNLAPGSHPFLDIIPNEEERARRTAAGLRCETCGTCGLWYSIPG